MEINYLTSLDSLIKPEEVIASVEQVVSGIDGLVEEANALNPFIESDIVINGENPFLVKANSIKENYAECGKEMVNICNDAVEQAREEALKELGTLLKCVEDRLDLLESKIAAKKMYCESLNKQIDELICCTCDDPDHHDVTSLLNALARATDECVELVAEQEKYLIKADEIHERILAVKNLNNPVSTMLVELDLAIRPAEVVRNTHADDFHSDPVALKACGKALELASLDSCRYGKGWDWTLKDSFHGDCMGFVLQVYNAIGLGYDHNIGTNPITAGNKLLEIGAFEKVPFTGVDSLLPGDVVVYAGDINEGNSHVELYLGNNQLASAPQDKGMLHNYYDYAEKGWSYVLRYNSDYTSLDTGKNV